MQVDKMKHFLFTIFQIRNIEFAQATIFCCDYLFFEVHLSFLINPPEINQ